MRSGLVSAAATTRATAGHAARLRTSQRHRMGRRSIRCVPQRFARGGAALRGSRTHGLCGAQQPSGSRAHVAGCSGTPCGTAPQGGHPPHVDGRTGQCGADGGWRAHRLDAAGQQRARARTGRRAGRGATSDEAAQRLFATQAFDLGRPAPMGCRSPRTWPSQRGPRSSRPATPSCRKPSKTTSRRPDPSQPLGVLLHEAHPPSTTRPAERASASQPRCGCPVRGPANSSA